MKYRLRVQAFADHAALIVVLGMCVWVIGLYGDWTSPGSALIEQFTAEAPGRILLQLGLAIFLAVALHEIGHLVAGLSVGFRFLRLSVGPLLLQRTPAGLRAGLNRSFNVTGGVATLVPAGGERLRERMRWVILGGPLANLVVAIGATIASAAIASDLAWTPRPQIADYLTWSMLNSLGLISFGFFAVSLVPMTTKGLMSDGRRFARLLQGGVTADRETAMLLLTGLSVHGTRPRDLPETPLNLLIAHDERDPFGILGRFFGYYHHLDHGASDRAFELLRTVLGHSARLPVPTRQLAEAEHAYWLAVFKGATAQARAALGRAGRCENAPAARLRAEAAVLLAEGRQEEAAVTARRAAHVLRTRHIGLTVSAAENEWIDDILRRAETSPPVLA